MFDNLFSFLGFNSGETLVGLSKLDDKKENSSQKEQQIQEKKQLKLSDLMRGC